MMKPPSPQAQLLLARYKTTQSLGESESARLLEVVRSRTLRGDLPRFDVQPTTAALAEAGVLQRVWASSLGKLGVALVLLGVPVAGLLLLQSESPAPSPPAPARLAPVVAASSEPAAAALQAPPESPPLVTDTEVPADPRGASRAKAERPGPGASSSSATTESTIDEEMRLMNAAQAALRGNDPQRALQLLREHAAAFPTGKLTSAREVTRIMALCQSGRGEQARGEAERFLTQHPGSPFADRVKKICPAPRSKP